MILEQFLLSINETNCYVIGCTDTGAAAVIDPGEWGGQPAAFLREQGLNPVWILLTHGHADHTGGVEQLRKESNARVAAHPGISFADLPLQEGMTVEVGKLKLRVLETPGHTRDSLTFVIGTDAFSGDALFAGSIGGTKDEPEDRLLRQSIWEKIFSLGDDIVVHPGHGPATTVLIERLFNPFFLG